MTSRKEPSLKAYLVEIRDKRRANESGDERFYSVEALKALKSGNVEALARCLLEIGRIQGRMQGRSEVTLFYKPIDDEYIKNLRRKYQAVKAMRDGNGQAVIPEATKQAAVAMFYELQQKDPDAKLSKLTAKVCEEFDVSSRSLDRWRKSFATR